MEKAYESKVNGEIRRTLQHLSEACKIQEITMEQAVEWWNEVQDVASSRDSVEELSYRERAEEFVEAYIDENKQPICVEVLCFLHDKNECPKSSVIVDEIISKVTLPISRGEADQYTRDIVWEFVKNVDDNRSYYHIKRNWHSLRNKMFMLSKSL